MENGQTLEGVKVLVYILPVVWGNNDELEDVLVESKRPVQTPLKKNSFPAVLKNVPVKYLIKSRTTAQKRPKYN